MKREKKCRFSVSCISVITIVNLLCVTFGVDYALAESIKVPSGTAVNVRLSQVVSPETHYRGDNVIMSVARDVSVNGKVVIKAGAIVNGEVMHSSTKSFVGQPAKIAVAVTSVEAVDATQIMLGSQTKRSEGSNKMALSIILGFFTIGLTLLMKGGDASIPAGATIVAGTVQTVTVLVEEKE